MAETHDDKISPYESLRVDRSGGVVTITLDRPERKNAINGAMWNELSSVVGEIARSSADRVVVITGAGGEFCSGADLAEPSARQEHPLSSLRRVGDLCLAIARLPQPTIAKVRGVAVGAGLNLALVCDLVVAAEGARLLGDLRQARPEPRLRRVVDPPAARRHAPRQGAGIAGSHHRCPRGV